MTPTATATAASPAHVAPTSRPEWAAVEAQATRLSSAHLRELFKADPNRGPALSFEGPGGMLMDISKQRIDAAALSGLLALARACGVEQRRDAMFAGEKINSTEKRAVLHVALRAPKGSRIMVDGQDVVGPVHEVLDRMSAFADSIRSGAWTGHTGKRIRNVVNIGIGGSDLGPAMAYGALADFADHGIRCRFVSNVDANDFFEKTRDCDPAETLFIVASKTFTTLETMTNAATAREWLLKLSVIHI